MSRAHLVRRLSTSALLPAALVTAVALAGLGGGITVGAQHHSLGGHVQLASALEPTDGMSYDLTTSDRGDLSRRYDAVINDIRGRLRGGRLYNSILLTQGGNDFFPVTLAVGQNQITMVFNARNLYVVGWRNDRTGVYYRLGAGPESYPGQNGATQNRPWLNYSDMERAGQVDRGSMAISMGSILGSISDLANGNTNNRDQARALLILVQAFAEGARYDFISYRISHAIGFSDIFYAGSSSTVSGNGSNNDDVRVSAMDLENNWGGLSNAAINSTNNHTNPNYQIGDGRFTTMQAIDAQLAVALQK